MKTPDGEVLYGIDGGFLQIYDGVIVWVMEDGRWVNRFEGEPGWEHVSEKVARYIATEKPKHNVLTEPEGGDRFNAH